MKILNLALQCTKPLYLQCYEEIKKQIQEGILVANEKLPSKKIFMKTYSISQSTIEHALYLLVDEGYLYSQERKGYFVAPIENIFFEKKEIPETRYNLVKKKDYLYDFSYSGVDSKSFPKSIFKKLANESLKENDDFLQLGEIEGYYPLRKEISKYLLHSRGVEARIEQIIISSGTEYLFNIIFKLFGEKNYGIENPGYPMLKALFRSHKMSYMPISLDQDGLIVSELEEKKVEIACITPSHQFPSGKIMPLRRRNELLHWAREEKGRYIIEDDYDSEFKYRGRPIPALKANDVTDKVIYLGSFSKSISPSLRISYMVLPQHLLEEYHRILPYLACSVSTLQQKILFSFMEQGYFTRQLNRMRTIYRKKREFLVNCIQKQAKKKRIKIEILGADAGLHLVLRLQEEIEEEKLATLCEREGLKVYFLSEYDEYKRKNEGFLFGYASLEFPEIEEGICLFFDVLSKYQKDIFIGN